MSFDSLDPLVSVIIPTRNRRALLEEAVESVRRQTYANWELIVVDDCSEDDTWAWLSSLDDPRIRSIRLEEHSERSAARNRGLEEAKGEWVLFLDDDDRLRPNALELLVKAATRKPKTVAAVGARIEFDSRGHRRRQYSHPRMRLTRFVLREVIAGLWAGTHGQVLCRTELIRDQGGYPAEMVAAEDQIVFAELAARGRVAIIPQAVLYYRHHSVRWRPSDAQECFEAWLRAFVDRLPEEQRRLASGALGARSHVIRGFHAWRRGSGRDALRELIRGLAICPSLAVSPVSGPVVAGLALRSSVGAIVGKRVTMALRRMLASIRTLLRRSPSPGRVETGGSARWRHGTQRHTTTGTGTGDYAEAAPRDPETSQG